MSDLRAGLDLVAQPGPNHDQQVARDRQLELTGAQQPLSRQHEVEHHPGRRGELEAPAVSHVADGERLHVDVEIGENLLE